ncbi:rab3 GTPase-activating protein catalytic subunit isoform X2 [Telopea speciosissima]|uniref:rab3 GTPase-activating protein catalytic subunit isoform X2 n=1 Tax=Telopea speciosissima TaxID=54955 RepID=UPI001CC82490|nr:rab3 GTPase-activating protein catalytic subunit isoform X2 [Telopea speciosissima]
MESTSLVSKAKTAFHSAAAKAEKVLTDIKADLKTDRETEGQSQSQKTPRELAEQETIPIKDGTNYDESEQAKGKPALSRRKHDWQDRLKIITKGKSGVVDKDRFENLNLAALSLDEYLDQIEAGDVSEMKVSERGSSVMGDTNAAGTPKIPTASAVKQLRIAVEAGKKFKSMKDLLASARDSSPVKERAGLSFSAVKSLVLREKDEKLTSQFVDDEILSLIHFLFNEDGLFPWRKDASDSATATASSLPRDVHAAPPEGFVVRLSEVIGTFKTVRKMALFWCTVVDELRRRWSEGQPVPGVPLDESPDLNSCLLHQQLQVINSCISRKQRRCAATELLDSIMREANPVVEQSVDSHGMVSSVPVLYARSSTGDLVLRLGADHPSENLTMLETGEPVYSPITQEGPILTEDLIRETEEFVLRTGSVGAGCSQLLSDMQAFKAANPGCILEDFVRWHSPPDWNEAEPSIEIKDSIHEADPSSKRGQLSTRMQKEGNLWRELWETSKPLAAVKQAPLFDEDLAVEGILNILEDIPPFELFRQLFLSLLCSGFVIAEATLSTNSNFSKPFYDCKDYIIATCQQDIWSDNVDDLLQVYETVETILVHPEDGLKIIGHAEETSPSEPKRRFKKLGLNFGVKDGNFLRRQALKDQKKPEESPTRQVLSNLFDGKSYLFAKKPPKPTSASQTDLSQCLDENEWTVV